jgi:hypothetical protein
MPFELGLRVLLETNGYLLDHSDQVYVIRKKPPQTTPNYLITMDSNDLFKIDVTGTDLALLLRRLAKRAGVNLVLYSNVKATINSVQLDKVSLDTAFDYILKGTNFIWKRIDDTYFVGDASGGRLDSIDLVSTQDSQLMHIKVDEALSLLPPYLQMQNIKTIKDNNILIATGPPELLARRIFASYRSSFG